MKRIRTQLIVSHVLLVTLVLVVLFMPNERSVYPAGAFWWHLRSWRRSMCWCFS